MYVSDKDLETIGELHAYVDGALESADGKDEHGNDIVEYWLDLSNRVSKLQKKMKRQNWSQERRKKITNPR